MKSKSPLVILEQLLMLLVFALAAALCLQAFALADIRSKDSSATDDAILELQQAAEILKYCRGDMALAAEMLDAEAEEGGLVIKGAESSIHISPEDSGQELLGKARVWAEDAGGNCLFEIWVGWQKGGAA